MTRLPLLLTLLTCLLAAPAGALAATPQEIYQQGNKAYFAGDYAGAEDAYRDALAAVGGNAPVLLLNLGNCAYFRGKLGLAAYYFKRATMLGSGDVAARGEANLASTRRALQEKYRKQLEKGVLRYDEGRGAWHALFTLLPTAVSGPLFVVLWLFLFAALSAWTFSRSQRGWHSLARTLFFSLLAPALVAAVLYFGGAAVAREYRYAVVVSPEAQLRDAPSPDAPSTPVPEGLEVRVLLHNEAGFHKVLVGEGKTGYLADSDVRALSDEEETR
jgi:tetratricopeptide (TPR) repeat protein